MRQDKSSKVKFKRLIVAFIFIFTILLSSSSYAAGLTHKVLSGESWWSIGQRYGINYNTLAQANGRSASGHIYVGEVLTIPGKTSTPTPTPKPNPGNPVARHTVARGESWWSIGQKYQINYITLATFNGKKVTDTIFVGQVLNIPVPGATNPTPLPTTAPKPTTTPKPTPPPTTDGTHRVVTGESWWSISIKYGVNMNTLAKANGRTTAQFIFTGETLLIPGQASTPTPLPTATPQPTATPVPTKAPEPTPTPASPDIEVLSFNTIDDNRMKAQADTYKVIMAPNTISEGSDPGLGLGMMVQTPNGKTIVIDGGMQLMLGDTTELATGDGTGELAKVKEWLSLHASNTVDTWILTHPHNDHIRVPAAIIHEGSVNIGQVFGVWYPKHIHDQKVGDETALQSAFAYDAMELVKSQGKYTEISPGLTTSIDGVNIRFLNGYNENMWRENDSSAVIHLSFDGSSRTILLLVDIQEEAANLLMERYPEFLSADVVQMSHHGMDPLRDLYGKIAPSINLVPAGHGLAHRTSIQDNVLYMTNTFGTKNYWATDQWHMVVIRK